MIGRNYLVGTRKDRYRIQTLLNFNKPAGYHGFDYWYFCKTFVEVLRTYNNKSVDVFDYALPDMLDDLDTDVYEWMRERGIDGNFRQYLLDVEDAMQYFKNYLIQLDFFPLPEDLVICEGTPGTVLLLKI